jgi:hypothetical protein
VHCLATATLSTHLLFVWMRLQQKSNQDLKVSTSIRHDVCKIPDLLKSPLSLITSYTKNAGMETPSKLLRISPTRHTLIPSSNYILKLYSAQTVFSNFIQLKRIQFQLYSQIIFSSKCIHKLYSQTIFSSNYTQRKLYSAQTILSANYIQLKLYSAQTIFSNHIPSSNYIVKLQSAQTIFRQSSCSRTNENFGGTLLYSAGRHWIRSHHMSR